MRVSPRSAYRWAAILISATAFVPIQRWASKHPTKPISTRHRWHWRHEFRRHSCSITPVGQCPPACHCKNGKHNGKWQTFHLSQAETCSDNPDHLSLTLIYHIARSGLLDVGDASKLTHVLSIAARFINDSDLEARVPQLDR